MKNRESAKRVARLLISRVGSDKDHLNKTLDFLSFLSNLYKRERLLRDFMLNPLIDVQKKLDYLRTLADRFGVPKSVDDVLRYMVELNLIPAVNEIKRLYEYEMEKLLKFSKAMLIVARHLDNQTIELIKEKISKALGKDIELEVQEDPSIIGGFIIKAQAFMVDASVKRALEKLG